MPRCLTKLRRRDFLAGLAAVPVVARIAAVEPPTASLDAAVERLRASREARLLSLREQQFDRTAPADMPATREDGVLFAETIVAMRCVQQAADAAGLTPAQRHAAIGEAVRRARRHDMDLYMADGSPQRFGPWGAAAV